MNRRIPNGAWCLWRANPTGTRQGKVVLAQHGDINDPELGGPFALFVACTVLTGGLIVSSLRAVKRELVSST